MNNLVITDTIGQNEFVKVELTINIQFIKHNNQYNARPRIVHITYNLIIGQILFQSIHAGAYGEISFEGVFTFWKQDIENYNYSFKYKVTKKKDSFLWFVEWWQKKIMTFRIIMYL